MPTQPSQKNKNIREAKASAQKWLKCRFTYQHNLYHRDGRIVCCDLELLTDMTTGTKF